MIRPMHFGRKALISCATVALFGAGASAQTVPSDKITISGEAAKKAHDYISISSETAEKLGRACIELAKKNNAAVIVVIYDPYGQVVYEHRMDGATYVNTVAAEGKARAALLTRAPSHVLTNRSINDTNTQVRQQQFGLFTQTGGLPIFHPQTGQLIGAIGVGGSGNTPGKFGEEVCAHNALEAVIGPQPKLLPFVEPKAGNQ